MFRYHYDKDECLLLHIGPSGNVRLCKESSRSLNNFGRNDVMQVADIHPCELRQCCKRELLKGNSNHSFINFTKEFY
jgi:hypothetical protein